MSFTGFAATNSPLIWLCERQIMSCLSNSERKLLGSVLKRLLLCDRIPSIVPLLEVLTKVYTVGSDSHAGGESKLMFRSDWDVSCSGADSVVPLRNKFSRMPRPSLQREFLLSFGRLLAAWSYSTWCWAMKVIYLRSCWWIGSCGSW